MKNYYTSILICLFSVLSIYSQIQLGQTLEGVSGVHANYGTSCAISGDGSRIAASSIPYFWNTSGNKSYITVHDYIGSQWTQVGSTIEALESNRLGYHLDMSDDGNRIAMSATGTQGGVGFFRVYEYNGTDWVQIGRDIQALQPAINASGYEIIISDDGNTVAFGNANYDDPDIGIYAGRASVYKYDGNDWVQAGSDLIGKTSRENFGDTLSFSGDANLLAVGRSGFDISINDGKAEVYKFDGTDWTLYGNVLDHPNGFYFGGTLDFSQDGQILSARINSATLGTYRFESGNWVLYGLIERDLDTPLDNFTNHKLSDDGKIMAVYGSDDNGRGIYYEWDDSSWVRKGNIIGNDIRGSGFASSLDMSNDGKTVVFGAPMDSLPNEGDRYGFVQVYDYSDLVLNTEDFEESTTYAIHPNPSSNEITISINNPFKDTINYIIINDLGQKVAQGEISKNNQTITIKSLAQGFYSLILTDDKGLRVSKKIIKN